MQSWHCTPGPRVIACLPDQEQQSLSGTATALWLVARRKRSAPSPHPGSGAGRWWGPDPCTPVSSQPEHSLKLLGGASSPHTYPLRSRPGSCLQLQTTKQEFSESFSILKRWAGCTQILSSHHLFSWHCWDRHLKIWSNLLTQLTVSSDN